MEYRTQSNSQPLDLATASRQQLDEHFMHLALEQAKLALARGEVPVGAVVVRETEVIASGHNSREADNDPAGHAEFTAICQAARTLARWRLTDCTVYVTLEPCLMCAALMLNARISRCVYAAADPKAGALGSLYELNDDPRQNHTFAVTTGVLAKESEELLHDFFATLRQTKPQSGNENR